MGLWKPFLKWPLHHHISETKRRISLSTLCICFLGGRFQKKYSRIHQAIVSAILEGILKMAALSKILRLSQKLRGADPSIGTLRLGFVGRRLQKRYCRIHQAIVSAIAEAVRKMAANSKVIRLSQKLRGAEPSISTLCQGFAGHRFQKKYSRIHQAIVSAILEGI